MTRYCNIRLNIYKLNLEGGDGSPAVEYPQIGGGGADPKLFRDSGEG